MADENAMPDGHVVALDVAESEFLRFTEAMDLDLDPKHWDAEDKKSFDDSKGKFLRAIQRGHLAVDEHGQPVFTPQLEPKTPITFYEPDGACIMAVDLAKKNHDAAKTFKVLAAMTKQPEGTFAKMKNRDLKICQAVLGLFLGSG